MLAVIEVALGVFHWSVVIYSFVLSFWLSTSDASRSTQKYPQQPACDNLGGFAHRPSAHSRQDHVLVIENVLSGRMGLV